MNLQKVFLTLFMLLLSSVAASEGKLYCISKGYTGLMPSDGIAPVLTISCTSTKSLAKYTVTARLNFSDETPYHATYYLKNADGTFTEITPETEIPFYYFTYFRSLEAEVEIFAKTTTTSSTIVSDTPNFTLKSPGNTITYYFFNYINYIRTSSDVVTMFKHNSRFEPAINTQTSVSNLQQIANLVKTDSLAPYNYTYSVPLLCHEAIFNKIKDMGIENLGDKCITSVWNTDRITIHNFVRMFISQVDETDNFLIPLSPQSLTYLHLMIMRYVDIGVLRQIKWPEDTPENHELSNLIGQITDSYPVEFLPLIMYTSLNSFGSQKYTYYAETTDANPCKLDIISRIENHYADRISQMQDDPEYYCNYIPLFYNIKQTFKNAYGVAHRLNSVAPVAGVLERINDIENLDKKVATFCNTSGTFGDSMNIFIASVTPDEWTDELKAEFNATPVSATSVHAIHKAGIYDLTSDDFKALPAKYLAATELDLTYIFDAFTALAEVVGLSQKAISAYFTSPVLAGTTTHIIEALADKEGETVQLEFAVKLMKDLYVNPCSYENPTYASAAVKKVADNLCACKNIINFTETAVTCEAVGLSVGAIAGIAVGAVVVVAAIAGMAYFLIKKKKSTSAGQFTTLLDEGSSNWWWL